VELLGALFFPADASPDENEEKYDATADPTQNPKASLIVFILLDTRIEHFISSSTVNHLL